MFCRAQTRSDRHSASENVDWLSSAISFTSSQMPRSALQPVSPTVAAVLCSTCCSPVLHFDQAMCVSFMYSEVLLQAHVLSAVLHCSLVAATGCKRQVQAVRPLAAAYQTVSSCPFFSSCPIVSSCPSLAASSGNFNGTQCSVLYMHDNYT